MDIINSYPKLLKLTSYKDRSKRRLKLQFDQERKAYYLPLKPELELENIDPRQLPDEKGIYALIDQLGETVYLGQGNIKDLVTSHKNDKLNFSKTSYSLVDDKEDRDFWESTMIDQYKKERGRMPYYNKQNGNNFSKLVAVTDIAENSDVSAA